MSFLQKNFSTCPKNVSATCDKTLLRPQLEYGSSLWDPPTKSNINKLEAVQRRAAIFCHSDYRRTSSVTAMMEDLGGNNYIPVANRPRPSCYTDSSTSLLISRQHHYWSLQVPTPEEMQQIPSAILQYKRLQVFLLSVQYPSLEQLNGRAHHSAFPRCRQGKDRRHSSLDRQSSML